MAGKQATNVVVIDSEAKFDTELKSAEPNQLLVLFFFAKWNPPCAQMSGVLDELAKEHADVKFVKIEAEDQSDVTLRYPDVKTAPTFILLRGGSIVGRQMGADAPSLVSLISTQARVGAASAATDGVPRPPMLAHTHTPAIYAGATSGAATTTSAPAKVAPAKVELKDLTAEDKSRLGTLIRTQPVMLFMKGSPAAPKCGFSRQLCELLKSCNITYGSFDILSDEWVRNSLKAFSNWPTYPQLYINATLVGGLDVVKELHADGGLVSMVPKECIEVDINIRLKQLTTENRVMLFMKGMPDAPQCGFSSKAIKMLRECGASFGYFNILTDERVREGLKTFSKWPTYPQLYVDGKLVGGVDVMTELHADNELAPMLVGSAAATTTSSSSSAAALPTSSSSS